MPLCQSSKAVISNSDIPPAGGGGGELVDLMDGKLLKEDVFPCLSRGEDSYRLLLTSAELLLQSINDEHETERFKLEDLFGVHTLKHARKKDQRGAYLCFYMYPRNKRSGILHSVKYRERTPLVFLIQKPGKLFEENLALATQWKDETLKIIRHKFPRSTWTTTSSNSSPNAINNINQNQTITNNGHNGGGGGGGDVVWSSSSSSNNMNEDFVNGNGKSVRVGEGGGRDGSPTGISNLSIAISSYHLLQTRYLVILNPKSGQGKTLSIYCEKVAPILQEAGIRPELFITQRPGHANTFVNTANFNDMHGICTVGGDGLLFEVVNGLRSRPDAHRIVDLPVGVIAGGSGNGLARSLAAYCGESGDYIKNPVLTTTLAVARGKVVPVNISEAELDDKKIYSFLSAGWGLLADIDIESEVLRPIGEPRFTLWSLLRVAKLKKYKAQVSYIPVIPPSSTSSPLNSVPNPNSNNSNPSVKERRTASSQNNETSNGNSPSDLNETSTTNNANKNHPKRVVIDDHFISVYSSIQSYIGSDLIFAPTAQRNDGLIFLTVIRSEAGRPCALQFLLNLDKGTHVSVAGVNCLAVSEFSIHSAGGIAGHLVIDGELVSGESLTVRICPKPLQVFSL